MAMVITPVILLKSKFSKNKSSLLMMALKLTLLKKEVKHVLTHQIIYADFYLLETQSKPELPKDFIWINESELDNYAIPRLVEILTENLNLLKNK